MTSTTPAKTEDRRRQRIEGAIKTPARNEAQLTEATAISRR